MQVVGIEFEKFTPSPEEIFKFLISFYPESYKKSSFLTNIANCDAFFYQRTDNQTSDLYIRISVNVVGPFEFDVQNLKTK